MKSLNELVREKMTLLKMNRIEAQNYVCQEIIINKISKSELVDKVFLKGGVVLYNMTKNSRRTTRDIDFDLAHYDISTEESIKLFVNMLNLREHEYTVSYIKSELLHQDDYRGRRVHLKISDKKNSLNLTVDIGVHTLFAIDQIDSIFDFGNNGDKIMVKINPPEQMIAEKLYSLAKHSVSSQRIRDLFDIYYLLTQCSINKTIIKKCFECLLIGNTFGFKTMEDIADRIYDTLNNDTFKNNVVNSNRNWINIDYQIVCDKIIELIYKI